jgi:hypothetical protein
MPHEIKFQDADFPHHNAGCWSRLEGWHLRWMPYGMPRLSFSLRQSVIFLSGRNPKTGKISGPKGTCILIGVHDGPLVHICAITAAHVVNSGASIVRVNCKGGSRPIEFDPAEWTSVPDEADLAAVDITDKISKDDYISFAPSDTCRAYSLSRIASDAASKSPRRIAASMFTNWLKRCCPILKAISARTATRGSLSFAHVPAPITFSAAPLATA